MNQEGIGLGLTITKQIVESADGKLTVESAGPGKGSVFSFSMKMTKVVNQIRYNRHLRTGAD